MNQQIIKYAEGKTSILKWILFGQLLDGYQISMTIKYKKYLGNAHKVYNIYIN